jgi:hypothetical protein
MSTEYYLYDKKRNEIFSLRDLIKDDILDEFICRVYFHDDYTSGGPLEIIQDDVIDTFERYPKRVVFDDHAVE